jgi:hypothetical protein
MARSGGEERSGATRSHAQRVLPREHGEDGEHRTFPAVSTMAHSAPAGGPGHHAAFASARCAATIASTRTSRVFSSCAGSGTG